MKQRIVDVVMLSGFLGSGKTTLLSHLLEFEKRQNRQVGVLMNELGDVSVDSDLIPGGPPLRELLDGCICCSIQGQLGLQLQALLDEYPLDVIYIEATGAAHPMDVLDACTHPSLAKRLRVRVMLTVVDGRQWKEKEKLRRPIRLLLEEQCKFADVVLVNKTDLLSEEDTDGVIQSIRGVNPSGYIYPVQHAKIPPEILLTEEYRVAAYGGHRPVHVHHYLHLRSFVCPVSKPLDRAVFEKWLRSHKDRIYRAKGFVKLKEASGMYLFQFAYGEPMFLRYHSGRRSPANARSPEPLLVFIGEQLEPENMKKDLLQVIGD